LFFQPYNEEQENVVLVGPIPGEQYQEIIFQCHQSETDKNMHYGKYPVHLGANRGRGQVYPHRREEQQYCLQRFRSWHYYQDCQSGR